MMHDNVSNPVLEDHARSQSMSSSRLHMYLVYLFHIQCFKQSIGDYKKRLMIKHYWFQHHQHLCK
jgi:hypothetical protein